MVKTNFCKKTKQLIHPILSEIGIKKRRDKIISELINRYSFETYVGIGIYKAIVSKRIVKRCKSLKKVYLIDPYKGWINPKGDKISQSHMNEIYNQVCNYFKNYPNVSLIRKSSETASKQFKKGEVDIVFIDAVHTYEGVKKDINLCLPKLKKGGIIAGHDYQPSFPGVIKAVDEIFNKKDLHLESDSVWWIKQ